MCSYGECHFDKSKRKMSKTTLRERERLTIDETEMSPFTMEYLIELSQVVSLSKSSDH